MEFLKGTSKGGAKVFFFAPDVFLQAIRMNYHIGWYDLANGPGVDLNYTVREGKFHF